MQCFFGPVSRADKLYVFNKLEYFRAIPSTSVRRDGRTKVPTVRAMNRPLPAHLTPGNRVIYGIPRERFRGLVASASRWLEVVRCKNSRTLASVSSRDDAAFRHASSHSHDRHGRNHQFNGPKAARQLSKARAFGLRSVCGAIRISTIRSSSTTAWIFKGIKL